jgi:hypothetical protein
LLIFQWLQTDACLANSNNNYSATFSSSRLVLLVRKGNPDLGNAVWGQGWGRWAAENRGLLIVDIDA